MSKNITPEALYKAYQFGIDPKLIDPADGQLIKESDIDRFIAYIKAGKGISTCKQ